MTAPGTEWGTPARMGAEAMLTFMSRLCVTPGQALLRRDGVAVFLGWVKASPGLATYYGSDTVAHVRHRSHCEYLHPNNVGTELEVVAAGVVEHRATFTGEDVRYLRRDDGDLTDCYRLPAVCAHGSCRPSRWGSPSPSRLL
jgi:hypothetical protein